MPKIALMECVQTVDINPNLSPLMFYSDEEKDEEENDVNKEECSSSDDNAVTTVISRDEKLVSQIRDNAVTTVISRDEKLVSQIRDNAVTTVISRDEKLVSQIRLVMTGVPPPPSFTTPKLDTLEILRLWNDNQHLINDIIQSHEDKRKSAAAAVETEAKETAWPQVLQIDSFGIHYNKSKASEELEWLCSKYSERFVGNETSSWINILHCRSPVRTASAKKRARYPGWGHSPGRRLSHLARRKQAFTSANLQNMAGSSSGLARNKKMILIEMKKPNIRQKIKTRNSSSKKRPVIKIKNNLKNSNNPKRALFQSPDDKPNKIVKITSITVKQSPNQLRIQRSKRALWPHDEQSVQINDINSNGKRGRKSLTPSPRKKCNRSLFFDGSISKSASRQSMQQNSPLSNPHQKKLLWAISQALRDEGIRMNHQIFHSCLSVLNGPCMALWIWKTSKNPPHGSTSENMLTTVKQLAINTVVEQVQANSSSSNLISLRLGLMQKVEIMKSKNTSIKSEDLVNSATESSEFKIDKENISRTDSLVSESSYAVLKKSPLKDNNVKCDTPVKVTLIEDCSVKSNLKTKQFLDNSEEPKSVKNDEHFDVDVKDVKSILKKQTPLKSNTEETNTITFSELLSWNSDPISRLQIKAPDLNPVFMVDTNGLKFLNSNLTSENFKVNFGDQKQNFGPSVVEENSSVEFETNDDETQSSSIYSFDLNNFVDESRTCFEFSAHNILPPNVCGFEET